VKREGVNQSKAQGYDHIIPQNPHPNGKRFSRWVKSWLGAITMTEHLKRRLKQTGIVPAARVTINVV